MFGIFVAFTPKVITTGESSKQTILFVILKELGSIWRESRSTADSGTYCQNKYYFVCNVLIIINVCKMLFTLVNVLIFVNCIII